MKKFLIPAALEKASLDDCFNKDGSCMENKMFFLKHYFSNKMDGYYRVVDGTGKASYYIKELQKLVVLNLVFQLKPVIDTSEFVIKLAVEQATEFDFFCSGDPLTNVIFYVDTDEAVKGPYNSNQFTPSRIRNGLAQGNIFIPSKKQSFETIENKQIA